MKPLSESLIGFAEVTVVSSYWYCASICAGVLFFEVFCSRLRALPRVATQMVRGGRALTGGYMVAARYQLEHVIVHRDVLVLRERLLLLSFFERLRDLLLEVARLDCVDDLHAVDGRRDLR